MWVSLPELEAIIGTDGAKRLCVMSGGVPIHIPSQPRGADLLTRALGMPTARALAAIFGGNTITVPNGNREEPHKGRILRLLSEGKSKSEIALECGVTLRYVFKLAEGDGAPKGKKNSIRADQWLLPM
jgi:hypothetical protein